MEMLNAESYEKELHNLDAWDFYNEGNNNLIFRYTGPHPVLRKKIIRIRKSTNIEFYTDPFLMPEQEYNTLFLEHVLLVDPVLGKYIPSISNITSFGPAQLRQLELKAAAHRKNKGKKTGNALIDYQNPQVLLVTSFACHEEKDGEETNRPPIIGFESKPKSGVTEYLPLKVKDFIQESYKDTSNTFYTELTRKSETNDADNQSLAKAFFNCQISKFEIM